MPRTVAIAAALLVVFGVLEISSYESKQHERLPAVARGVLVQVDAKTIKTQILNAESYRVMLRAANRLHMGERVLARQIRVTQWSLHVMLISGPGRDALAVAACYRDYVS